MEDLIQDVADAQRVLNAYLSEMADVAAMIEYHLVVFTHTTGWEMVEKATTDDPHRTQTLYSTGSLYLLREEEERTISEFPERIHASLARDAWRHLYVDTTRVGSGNIMSDLDYGIWQDTGYKIPLAYEAIVNNLLSKVYQLLRKYGYRPDFGGNGAVHRHSAPVEAIPAMEQYYKLSMRLADTVTGVERIRLRADVSRAGAAWDSR